MATGNMHKNLVKFGHMAFELCKGTDRQTDILITILCNPTRGGDNYWYGSRGVKTA